MGRPVRQFETNGWLAVATLGLGCCLAATESERYTALWNFGTRGFDELALIAVLLVAAVALLCAAARRGRQACDDVRVVVGVGAVALVGSALRLGGATVPLSPMAILAGSLATQFSSILLVLYAQFFLQVGVKKATIALACAFMVSGMLQVAGAGVPAGFARAATVCFPLLATAALVLAPRLRGGIEAAQDLEDVEIEAEGDAMHLRDGRYAVWCASLFLLNVLLIVLHDQAMALQDGSSLSRLVQACSGLGSAVAGVLFLVIMRSLHGSQLLSLLRILILPVVMLALYASMLAGGLGTAFYLMLLGACYATLLLFIWLLPRRFKDRGTWFPALGVAYVSYRLGWAFGIWRVQLSADGDATAVTVTCFVALVALSVFEVVRLFAFPADAVAEEDGAADGVPDAFARGCSRAVERCGLSPRESQVLPFLAKGRNARYIAGELIISDGTARTHIMHIYQKLGVHTQQELIDVVEGMARE